jgi:hypothetical protein
MKELSERFPMRYSSAKQSLYEKVTAETIQGIISVPVYFQRA